MERGLFNIITSDTTELIPMRSGKGGIRSISLCNYSATDDASVTLFLEDASGNYSYLLYAQIMPSGSSLVLDHNVSFNDAVLKLSLTLASTDPKLSVILK